MVALIFIGLLVGFIGGLLGVGGGFILVPLLTSLLRFDAHQAIGTSLAAGIFTGFFSAFSYFKQKRLDWKLGLLIEVSTVPGALIGSYSTIFFSSKELKILLSVLLTGLSISMLSEGKLTGIKAIFKNLHLGTRIKIQLWERKIRDSKGMLFEYKVNVLKLLLAVFPAGLASGFFGIGGGVMVVPVLCFLGIPVHIAVATSTLIVTLTALSGTICHMTFGHVLWTELVYIIFGIFLGTQMGTSTAWRTRSKTLKKVFATVLMAMAVLLLMR